MPNAQRPTPRRAHTLPELLLVLTILSLLALVALPRFISAVSSSRLRSGLDAARDGLSYARSRAIATGLRHQFMVDAQSGEIVIEPFHPDEAVNAGAPAPEPDVALRDQLPEEIRVAEWRVAPLGMGQGQGAEAALEGGGPLVFYPEGQSDSAVLILEDREGERRGVSVDGFTGEIRELERDEIR